MTSKDTLDMHSWAMKWIHVLTTDERQGTNRLSIGMGYDADGAVIAINNQREIHITFLLGPR